MRNKGSTPHYVWQYSLFVVELALELACSGSHGSISFAVQSPAGPSPRKRLLSFFSEPGLTQEELVKVSKYFQLALRISTPSMTGFICLAEGNQWGPRL